MKEIERRWMPPSIPDLSDEEPSRIVQGYIAAEERTVVRVRKNETYKTASLTVKNGDGLQRDEIELDLSEEEADALLRLAKGNVIRKDRYELQYLDRWIVVDLFDVPLFPLCIIEVEFSTQLEAHQFFAPPWFGWEVTDVPAYSNYALAKWGL